MARNFTELQAKMGPDVRASNQRLVRDEMKRMAHEINPGHSDGKGSGPNEDPKRTTSA
jgi:hypothetical protein